MESQATGRFDCQAFCGAEKTGPCCRKTGHSFSSAFGMDQWYFAYGSNLLASQMVRRTGPLQTGANAPRRATLANYRVAFNHRGTDGMIYANIVTPGDGVLGVVYRCSKAALAKLDRFETGYERREVSVVDQLGNTLTAIAYVGKPDSIAAAGRPSDEYLARIVDGAREYGLPEEYIETIVERAKGMLKG